jgi:hypothetical protein
MYRGATDSNQKIILDGLVVNIDASQLRSYSGTGTTWSDLSGRGNNWTLNNNPSFSAANGGYFTMDNVDDNIFLSYNSSIPAGSSARTVMIWFYTTATSWGVDVNNLFYEGAGNATTRASFAIDMDNYPNMQVWTSADDIIFSTPFSQTGWANICVTYNGATTILVYCNGILYGTKTLAAALNTDGWQLYLGSAGIYGAYFDGRIAQFLMYNKALIASEVLQNYNATKTRFGL